MWLALVQELTVLLLLTLCSARGGTNRVANLPNKLLMCNLLSVLMPRLEPPRGVAGWGNEDESLALVFFLELKLSTSATSVA